MADRHELELRVKQTGISAANAEIKRLEQAIEKLKNKTNQTTADIAKQTKLQNQVAKENVKLFDLQSKGLDKAAKSQNTFTASIMKTNKALHILGGLIILQQLVQGVKYVFNLTKEFDRWNRTLEASLSGLMTLEEAQTFLMENSRRLGLVYREQIRGFSQFSAAAKAVGVPLEDIKNIYLAIGEASTVFQLSADDNYEALRAITQMMSKGTISAEELRGQLGERIPGALAIMAKSINVSTRELLDMMDKGELLSSEVLPKFAAALRKEMENLLPTATKSLQAEVNRLKTEWERFVNIVGDWFKPLFRRIAEGMADALETINKAMEPEKITESLDELRAKKEEILKRYRGGTDKSLAGAFGIGGYFELKDKAALVELERKILSKELNPELERQRMRLLDATKKAADSADIVANSLLKLNKQLTTEQLKSIIEVTPEGPAKFKAEEQLIRLQFEEEMARIAKKYPTPGDYPLKEKEEDIAIEKTATSFDLLEQRRKKYMEDILEKRGKQDEELEKARIQGIEEYAKIIDSITKQRALDESGKEIPGSSIWENISDSARESENRFLAGRKTIENQTTESEKALAELNKKLEEWRNQQQADLLELSRLQSEIIDIQMERVGLWDKESKEIYDINKAVEEYKEKIQALEINGEKMAQMVREFRKALEDKRIQESLYSFSNFISDGIVDPLGDAITGAMSFKDAFSEMARSILNDLARMAMKAAFMQAFGLMFGGAQTGSSLGIFAGGLSKIFGFEKGGIVSGGFKSFADGGVINSPTIGMIGEGKYNEAVVPLPDGRSIPVSMKGSQGDTFNINVNVDGSKMQNPQDAKRMGNIVASQIEQTVKRVLYKEKRVGGMLYAPAW